MLNKHLVLSLVIPTYNSIGKFERMLNSLIPLLQESRIEIIFVDDCSKDDTYSVLKTTFAESRSVQVLRLDNNSGSASTPRNIGIENAQGSYVFFLDSDDSIQPKTILSLLDELSNESVDIYRAPILISDNNSRQFLVDVVPHWRNDLKYREKLALIVKHQGMTASSIIRRSLLVETRIRFPTDRRIGEDISFIAQVLVASKTINYCEQPFREYSKNNVNANSVTQSLRSSDFGDFFRSWQFCEKTLSAAGVSFVELHGLHAVNYAMHQYLLFQTGAIDQHDFLDAVHFVRNNWKILSKLPFGQRVREQLVALKKKNLHLFENLMRLRVLAAGYDLKFFNEIASALASNFDIKVDNWDGHTQHNPSRSRELARWADVIFCEWLHGNVEWFSKLKESKAPIVVRCHRHEALSPFGERFDRRKVKAFIAISPHGLDDFSERFAIPRRLFSLIPNAVDVSGFEVRSVARDKNSSLLRLLMVGLAPKLKGLHRAVQVVDALKQRGENVLLTVYGKSPDEISWVWNNSDERNYFESVFRYIDSHGLRDNIEFVGWANLKTAYAQHDILLSLSDFEGCQVAVLEAMAAGVVPIVRPWRGAKECYPSEFIVDDDAVVNRVLQLKDEVYYDSMASIAVKYVRETCDIGIVAEQISAVIKSSLL